MRLYEKIKYEHVETLLLDYQRDDHVFSDGIYQDPYSMKPQQTYFAPLQWQQKYTKNGVKNNTNKCMSYVR